MNVSPYATEEEKHIFACKVKYFSHLSRGPTASGPLIRQYIMGLGEHILEQAASCGR